MKRFLFTLCALCTATLAWAATEVVNGITLTYSVSSGQATITDCNSNATGVLEIPETLGGYPVTAIEYNAFSDCSGLTSVTIPEGVTSIGVYAFRNCTNLKVVNFPETTLTTLGNNLFEKCTSLTELKIPDSVTSIGTSAFVGCTNLKTVTLPEGLIAIKNNQFRGCSSLTSVNIPSTVKAIEFKAFSGCSSLTSVNIPSTVKTIEFEAFSGCSSLTSVEIPSSVTSIGGSAFSGCTGLPKDANGVQYESTAKKVLIDVPTSITGEFVIPDSVRFISSYAFSDCSGLTSITIPEGVTSIGVYAFPSAVKVSFTGNLIAAKWPAGLDKTLAVSVTIPEGVTSIGDYAFYDCSGLTSVTIPEGVTSIGYSAFRDCSGLTSVTIPSSVTEIGEGAFSGCSGLKEVHISDVAAWCAIDFSGYYSNPLYYVKNLYLNGELVTDLVIPESVTSIGERAFQYCSGLTSITIPSSVTSIGNEAFSGCSSLTSVTISEGVTSIEGYAFYKCSGLTSVTIPSSVTSIGDWAFDNCSGLKEVHISDIAAWCAIYFDNYSSNPLSCAKNLYLNGELITDLVIPEGVTSIGNRAFQYCSGLTSVTIPEGVTSIGSYAFYGCWGLTSFSLPASVSTMPENALPPSSTNLKILEVAEGNPLYYTNAEKTLLYNSAKTELLRVAKGSIKGPVELEPTVMIISNDAFSDCSGLTSITIPESVTSIGSSAFRDCSGLQAVHMKGPVPNGFADSGLRNYLVAYPKEYGASYKAVLGDSASYVGVIATAGVKVSAEMTTPKTMKVTYKVTSDLPIVKVRAVAFADGVRSFAKIVPVKSGENVPLGGEVTTNTEHTFVWNVSEDWDTELSKVAIEILVQEGELLPQELLTIPAVDNHPEMVITINKIELAQAFSALLWCYTEGDEELLNVHGEVYHNGILIAKGSDVLSCTDTPWAPGSAHYYPEEPTLSYLYGKMGFKILSGEDLEYARKVTRLELSSIFDSDNQYSIKIED